MKTKLITKLLNGKLFIAMTNSIIKVKEGGINYV